MFPKEPYKKFAVITMYVLVGLAAAYVIFHYLRNAILPFIIAYILAECFRPVVKYSESHKSFPKRSFVLFVVLLAAVSVVMLIYAIGRRVIFEVNELALRIKEVITRIGEDESFASETFDKLNSFVPFIDLRPKLWEMRTNLDESLWSLGITFGEKASGSIFSFIGSVMSVLPNIVFGTVVTVIATYYFAIDRVRINCFFLSLFPKSIRPVMVKTKDMLTDTVWQYLRAYGMLFCITFSELLLTFWILGISYSFVIALVIALIDVLPVLGAGIVLVPWGIIALLAGDYFTGTGILIAYAVITILRQITEPKIIGKFIGLSPLASLASMYIGLKLFGVAGIFVLPIGAIILKRILESHGQDQKA